MVFYCFRYNAVIHACCLQEDMESFVSGSETEVHIDTNIIILKLPSQIKDYKISIWCFSSKLTALSNWNTDLLVQNQDNVSESSDMFTYALLFQWASTIKMKLNVLV